MTEPLLLQQLESPSGTGRDEPRSQISLSVAPTTNADANRHTHSHWQIWRRPTAAIHFNLIESANPATPPAISGRRF